MKKQKPTPIGKHSYPLGLEPALLYKMIPEFVSNALAEAMTHFGRKIKGFENGVLMGLESKTSSPLQVAREKNGKCIGFDNLYFVWD